MVQSVTAAAGRVPAGPQVQARVPDVCLDLLELFAGVPDGRRDQGRDHPAAVVLALAAAAVAAGMKGYTTIWRVVTDADPVAFDAAVGRWLMSLAGFTRAGPAAGEEAHPALMQVRLDGKAVRGARDTDGSQVRLLAALVGPDAPAAVVAAQAEVGRKTNEVPTAAVVLDGIDLEHKVVTADALHTVRATARYIRRRGGHFVLPVKENRRALLDALDALPWRDVPVAHTATDKGHGLITTRTIQVLPAPEDLPFPHVSQVFLIERYVSDLAGKPVSAIAALGIASPAPGQAGPADLAGYVREQWSIESLHWLRDTLYQEDKSTVRTRSGPRIMAALRNLAIGALHLAGRHDTTEATRWASRYMDRPFTVLGLTS